MTDLPDQPTVEPPHQAASPGKRRRQEKASQRDESGRAHEQAKSTPPTVASMRETEAVDDIREQPPTLRAESDPEHLSAAEPQLATPEHVATDQRSPAPEATNPSADGTDQQQRSSQKANQPMTILELLELAYASPGKRIQLSHTQVHSLRCGDPTVEDEAIVRLAPQDTHFDAISQLLRLTVSVDMVPKTRHRLMDLAEKALSHHPVVPVDLNRQAPGPSLRDVGAKVDSAAKSANGPSQQGLKWSRLKTNMQVSVALLAVLAGTWDAKRLVKELNATLWADRRPARPDINVMMGEVVLGGSAAPVVLARLMQVDLDAANRKAETEAANARTEAQRAATAEKTSVALREQLQAAAAHAEELERDVQAQQRQYDELLRTSKVGETHMRDDYETLRTEVLRVVKIQISTLEDGAKALSKGHPEVAVDHVERVVDALRAQVRRLQEARV